MYLRTEWLLFFPHRHVYFAVYIHTYISLILFMNVFIVSALSTGEAPAIGTGPSGFYRLLVVPISVLTFHVHRTHKHTHINIHIHIHFRVCARIIYVPAAVYKPHLLYIKCYIGTYRHNKIVCDVCACVCVCVSNSFIHDSR
jgi:hypothetical protein